MKDVSIMPETIKDVLISVMENLPEEKAKELLDFAEFLLSRQQIKENDPKGLFFPS